MTTLGERIQHADWKNEKHVPAIECPGKVAAGEAFEIKLSVGKAIAHPNTTEHHISWITLYYQPDGSKFVYQVGHYEFSAHGQSTSGPNEGPVYTAPHIITTLKVDKPGTLLALAYCNIHGLWESSVEIQVS